MSTPDTPGSSSGGPEVHAEAAELADPAGAAHSGAPAHAPAAGRIPVRKTYKLYTGGAFPRSESGRCYPVTGSDGAHLANAALASRKDARDAVTAARSAFPGWSGRTAYNRGQILYRVAEMMEGRSAQFAAEIAEADGIGAERARELVSAAVDRWVYYAGWPDKIGQVLGAANPVSGPYFNLSRPEPTGVVAVLAPPAAPLLGLVSAVAPVIATGNTAVVVASERAPLPALTLAEALATSDLPGGVVNILTGRTGEIAPHLASHADVNGLDLTGAGPEAAADLERSAAETLKRVLRPGGREDWLAAPGISRMTPFLETKTVWHPVGV
ncbi:acyl-CoA reductase-like NAD-dependent aldehyde dehydrogenase [Streptomonospora salina]|uniref:Acyl-CoA reductase-like NAD-dependent aldehyde dehydrogenase n=1 Tax=Streptomonospora salina TaxID=104205 RepID=A0A841E7Z8_9ACTN|nr:acyl-CoA reductase-like NAD-dependent aldehyde dehydrogenase [Streptomonospora salina]